MKADQLASFNERLCFVCGETIPPREGLYHAGLYILTHRGACDTLVTHESRVYDRSTRGRWVPYAQVRQRLRTLREARACHLIVPGMIMGNTQERNTGVPTETPTPGD